MNFSLTLKRKISFVCTLVRHHDFHFLLIQSNLLLILQVIKDQTVTQYNIESLLVLKHELEVFILNKICKNLLNDVVSRDRDSL